MCTSAQVRPGPSPLRCPEADGRRMVQPLIWFVGQHSGGIATLVEALAMDFTVRECSHPSDVWGEMLEARPGIVVVDATGSTMLSPADRRNIAALCSVAPAVVLIDD